MPSYSFSLNGQPRTVESRDPDQPLLYVLRNAVGLKGAKFGCGLAQCGACTVIIDGAATRSCALPVSASDSSFGIVSRRILNSAFAPPFALRSTVCCASAKRGARARSASFPSSAVSR